MNKTKSFYHGHRFPAVVISCAVRWYFRFNVTDQLRSYPAAKAEIPELAQVKHVFVKAAARVNNRTENSHQPTRRRERQMCGFRDARRTQAFLSCFGLIRQHFALPRHQMNAACHRAILKERLATWHGWAVSTAVEQVI